MSLFASLYIGGSMEPAVALAGLRLGDPDVTGVSAVAVAVKRPHFLDEEYGIDPPIAVHFELDKSRSVLARASLATTVREFLSRTSNDALVMYLDIPVVRRVGDIKEVSPGYEDFVSDGGWTRRSIRDSNGA